MKLAALVVADTGSRLKVFVGFVATVSPNKEFFNR